MPVLKVPFLPICLGVMSQSSQFYFTSSSNLFLFPCLFSSSFALILSQAWTTFPRGSDSKASAYNVGDRGSIPGSGRSSGEGNANPLQYSCLENPMDGGAWQATVHEVAKSQTRLSDFTMHYFRLKKKKKSCHPKNLLIN